jgi:hypothetical protein
MPNLRLRAITPSASPFTLVLRPLLVIAGIAKGTAGAPLAQATVKVFATLTDVRVAREVSDKLGRYAAPVPDLATYYTLARQPGTADSLTLTADNNSITVDRMTSVQGATVDSLVGVG